MFKELDSCKLLKFRVGKCFEFLRICKNFHLLKWHFICFFWHFPWHLWNYLQMGKVILLTVLKETKGFKNLARDLLVGSISLWMKFRWLTNWFDLLACLFLKFSGHLNSIYYSQTEYQRLCSKVYWDTPPPPSVIKIPPVSLSSILAFLRLRFTTIDALANGHSHTTTIGRQTASPHLLVKTHLLNPPEKGLATRERSSQTCSNLITQAR